MTTGAAVNAPKPACDLSTRHNEQKPAVRLMKKLLSIDLSPTGFITRRCIVSLVPSPTSEKGGRSILKTERDEPNSASRLVGCTKPYKHAFLLSFHGAPLEHDCSPSPIERAYTVFMILTVLAPQVTFDTCFCLLFVFFLLEQSILLRTSHDPTGKLYQ